MNVRRHARDCLVGERLARAERYIYQAAGMDGEGTGD